MLTNKHLIIGASGLVGAALKKELQAQKQKNKGTYFSNENKDLIYLDLTNRSTIEEVFELTKPKYVYLCSALTNVDLCEKLPLLSYSINIDPLLPIVRLTNKYKASLIYFSTDYVFAGFGPNLTTDLPRPINQYGRDKSLAEQYISLNTEKYMIVRTCGVFGDSKTNFVSRLIQNLKKQEEISVPNDQYGTPTYAPELAKAVIKLTTQNKLPKLVHIVNQTWLSRYEFAQKIASLVGNDSRNIIKSVVTKNLKQAALRPKRGGLVLSKEIEMSNLDVVIEKYVREVL